MNTPIPTMHEIIDQIMVLSEHTRDQDERDTLTAMLKAAEPHIARQARIEAAALLALAIVDPATTDGGITYARHYRSRH